MITTSHALEIRYAQGKWQNYFHGKVLPVNGKLCVIVHPSREEGQATLLERELIAQVVIHPAEGDSALTYHILNWIWRAVWEKLCDRCGTARVTVWVESVL